MKTITTLNPFYFFFKNCFCNQFEAFIESLPQFSSFANFINGPAANVVKLQSGLNSISEFQTFSAKSSSFGDRARGAG